MGSMSNIPHSSTIIPDYEDKMKQDKGVLNAIDKYTDFKFNI